MMRGIQTQHDEDEFCRAYYLYARRVREYIARRVAADAVDDVLADVFVVLWRKRGSVQWDTNLEWWLLRVAYRCVGHTYRVSRRRSALVEKLNLERTECEEQENASLELVSRALLTLGAKDREVLKLDAWDELTARDAGLVLGITPAAYEKRLQRARQRFRQVFDQLSETPLNRTLIGRS
jgi:RNA polymerase sigma-70 factor (ECF subfamily)